MTCFLLGHKFGRAFSRGKRDRMGRWKPDGEDYQVCCVCGTEQVSPIQFGVAQDDAPVAEEEARAVRARAV